MTHNDDDLLALARLAGLQEPEREEVSHASRVEALFFGGVVALAGVLGGCTVLNVLGALL